MGCIDIDISRLNPIKASIKRKQPITISISLICPVVARNFILKDGLYYMTSDKEYFNVKME